MHSRLFWLLFVAGIALGAPTRASIIYDVANGITTAPSGDRGWAETGSWQVGGGVAVAPSYFLTAQHLGGTAGQPFVLNGRTFSAASFTDITGSDLRLVKITGTFPAYAPLYRGAAGSEAGQAISMIGFGRYAHGSALVTNGTQSGWNWGAAAGKNFAMNTAAGAVTVAGSQLIDYSFDPISGRSEGIYAAGDSGGGTFINTGGAWRLAGINFAVTNFYSQPLAPNPLQASIFNGSGLYVKDQNGNFVAATSPQFGYATEIAAYISRIDAVILPGDVNDDGSVNFADLLTLAQHYGRSGTYSQGDTNFDGQVNFNDLLTLAQHYGQSLTGSVGTAASAGATAPFASGIASVPEPVSLAAPLLAVLLTRRGRSRPNGMP
jgi:hypothetical protein